VSEYVCSLLKEADKERSKYTQMRKLTTLRYKADKHNGYLTDFRCRLIVCQFASLYSYTCRLLVTWLSASGGACWWEAVQDQDPDVGAEASREAVAYSSIHG